MTTSTKTQDELMREDAEEIRNKIIKLQMLASIINNKIDAFSREYDNDVSKAEIYIWSQNVDGTSRKVVSTAKKMLIADGIAKSISTSAYNVDVTYTPGGTSLDTVKFKKLDLGMYTKIATMFPKTTNPRASIKVTAKKGKI